MQCYETVAHQEFGSVSKPRMTREPRLDSMRAQLVAMNSYASSLEPAATDFRKHNLDRGVGVFGLPKHSWWNLFWLKGLSAIIGQCPSRSESLNVVSSYTKHHS